MPEILRHWGKKWLVPLLLLLAPHTAHADTFSASALSPEDGWAAKTYNNVGEPAAGLYLGFPLTGGNSADLQRPTRIVHVTDRDTLKRAAAGNEPVVIVVHGLIDLNQGKTASEYSAGTGYDFDQYQQSYLLKDSQKIASMEDARSLAAERQKEQCVVIVGANKSIVGAGESAVIRGGSLVVRGSNVIIRNLTFEDVIDFFPRWDPNENGGNWKAEYDSVTLSGAKNVWVDHCTFLDKIQDTADGALLKNANGRTPKIFRHDGLLDIVQGTDFVTVSYNIFANHDKTILVGAKSNNEVDSSRLSVTFHHNHFINCRSGSPLVRYGKVHIYNNWYEGKIDHAFGTGFAARIFSEGNFFDVTAPASKLAGYIPEAVPGVFFDRYSLYKAPNSVAATPVNLSLESGPPFVFSAGWNPINIYIYQLDNTELVPEIVGKYAGAGRPVRF